MEYLNEIPGVVTRLAYGQVLLTVPMIDSIEEMVVDWIRVAWINGISTVVSLFDYRS